MPISAAGRLHHWALLDMQFEPARPATRRWHQRARLAAVPQGMADAGALVVGDGERGLQHHVGGMDAAAHHRGAEAAALPRWSSSPARAARCVMMPASSSARITSSPASTPATPSKRPPVGTVSRWLPKARPRASVLTPLAAQEHVADRVLLEMQAEWLAPLPSSARACSVLGGQCQPATAAFRRRTDLRHLHDGLPEPIRIDGGSHGKALSSVAQYSSIWRKPESRRRVSASNE